MNGRSSARELVHPNDSCSRFPLSTRRSLEGYIVDFEEVQEFDDDETHTSTDERTWEKSLATIAALQAHIQTLETVE